MSWFTLETLSAAIGKSKADGSTGRSNAAQPTICAPIPRVRIPPAVEFGRQGCQLLTGVD
ncbi:hypothetical protein [Streptomyces lydicus]|uniref:hypothetical protein n=1 Tax=Streptomyces lydicus TaxID=47763 RepID=UPI0037B391C2